MGKGKKGGKGREGAKGKKEKGEREEGKGEGKKGSGKGILAIPILVCFRRRCWCIVCSPSRLLDESREQRAGQAASSGNASLIAVFASLF